MGSWDSGSFENDTALDWLGELYTSRDAKLVHATLTRVNEPHECFFQIDAEQRALAAAEIVACWLGHPPPEPRRAGLGSWVRDNFKFSADIVDLARQVVDEIKNKSALKTAWTKDNGEASPKWVDSITDLQRRLNS
jgi:hypothetical protein